MKKKSLAIVLSLVCLVSMLAGCAGLPKINVNLITGVTEDALTESVSTEDIQEFEELAPITILYTNDIHSYVNNMTEDAEGEEIPAISYDSIASLKENLVAAGENALLVDAGDHSQGTIYGAIDEGRSISEIMKAVGYDLATIGNHEFDYGQLRALDIMLNSPTPYVCCNFYSVETGELVLPAYKVFDVEGTKVAFVGIATPNTMTATSPVYFQNEKGEYIYKIYSGADGKELYDSVQKAIDAAAAEADYVIALGHCGVDGSSVPYRSTDIISNVSGLTAFIDGHSHTVMEGELIKDKDGKDVLLTQSGCNFGNIGKMLIDSEGNVSTELINDYGKKDEKITEMRDELVGMVQDKLGEKVATSTVTFYIMNSENPEERLVRRQETNLADLYADSIYWYFNEAEGLNCDIAVVNGGALRCDVPKGDWTYLDAKAVSPFGNVICLVEVSGQDIIDALEHGSFAIGLCDDNGEPAEYGGFLHVSGVKYEIDSSIESSEVLDDDNVWEAGPTGEYKVRNVTVYNKETKAYEEIDPEKKYAIGGINYLIRNCGDGMRMFDDSELIKDFVGEDYMIFSQYLAAFKQGDDGAPVISSENSPLSAYENFGIDYENPLGSGRITIK